MCRSSVSPTARCPGTTSWRQFIRRQYMKNLSMLLAPAAFAQGGEAAASSGSKGLLWIAAIIGVGISAFGCGLGQGRIGAAAQEGIARNPGAAKSMFVPLI